MRVPLPRIPALIGLAALLAAGMAFAQQDGSIYLHGLVPVRSISEDEDGLIVLEGLLPGFKPLEQLPAVLDFQVYSRWSGSGEHEVFLQLVAPDGETVLQEAGDRLALSSGECAYLVEDFRNTVFSVEGMHGINAWVDGELVASFPFPVGDVGEREMPDPVFMLSAPAGKAYIGGDGLWVVSGIFEYFAFERFPSADDFIVVNVWSAGARPARQITRLLSPPGKVLATRSGQVPAGPGRIAVVVAEFENFIFRQPGWHGLTVSVGEDLYLDVELEVVLEEDREEGPGVPSNI